MKQLFKNIMGLMLILSIISITFIACGSDDDDPIPTDVDRTELNTLLTECEQLKALAIETDYPSTNMALFSKLVEDAEIAADNENLSQNQINSIIKHLENGKRIFLASAYAGIPESAMVMSLNFEETDQNELITAGIRQLTAKLVSGPSEIFGSNTSKPTYVDGVAGGKAMHFAKGSHLEIDEYNPNDFLGNTMSIAVWLKTDEMKNGNYVASMNYWENWKLEIESHGKPFYTVKTTKGHVDADNQRDNSFSAGVWSHLVLSLDLSKGTLAIYVNGEETIVWSTSGALVKENLAGSMPSAYQSSIGKKLPFMIGAITSYEEANANWTWGRDWATPGGWSYFSGAMDNFAVYNIALEKGQAAKLYNDQRPR